jgi:hypothetical protein
MTISVVPKPKKTPKKKSPKVTVCCGTELKFSSKEAKEIWSAQKGICPSCGAFYSDKPETERRLAFKQDEYYAQCRHELRLVEMAELWKPYIRSLGYKIFGTAIGDKDNEEEFVGEVSSIIITRYCKNPNLYIESFAGYIKKVFLQIKVVGYGADHLEEEWEIAPESVSTSSDKSDILESSITHLSTECGSRFSDRFLNLYAFTLHIQAPEHNKTQISNLYTTFNKPDNALDNVLSSFRAHLTNRCQFSMTSKN